MKLVDVTTVVNAELVKEGIRNDDMTKTMSALHMTEISITLFLKAVRKNLKSFNPSYKFTFPPPSATDVLNYTIPVLIGKINDNTTQVGN